MNATANRLYDASARALSVLHAMGATEPALRLSAVVEKYRRLCDKRGKISGGLAQRMDKPLEEDARVFWLPERGGRGAGSTPVMAERIVRDSAGQEVAAPYRFQAGGTYSVEVKLRGNARGMAVADYLPAGVSAIPETLSAGTNEADFASNMTVNSKEMTEEHVLVYASLVGSGFVKYNVRAMNEGSCCRSGGCGVGSTASLGDAGSRVASTSR